MSAAPAPAQPHNASAAVGGMKEGDSSADSGGKGAGSAVRAIPQARSFHSVKHLWDWSAAPLNGGPSV
jgi:hypothetical protein